jgi:hypothetical protein
LGSGKPSTASEKRTTIFCAGISAFAAISNGIRWKELQRDENKI